MGILNDQLKMYRALQSKKLGAQQWYQIPVWADLMGFIGGTNKYGRPESVPFGAVADRKLKPTGKPIEVLIDYNYRGGSWEIEVPLTRPYVKPPVVGDDQAKGQEESRAWVYNTAYITQVRKPVKVSEGAMGDLAINPDYLKQLYDTIRAELEDYNRRLQAYSPYAAIYKGYDDQLIASKELVNCYQKSHINFYVAGFGKVPLPNNFDPQNRLHWSSYDNNIATAINGLQPTNKFTMKEIRNAQILGSRLMFVPTKAGAYPVKGVMIINDAQMKQLVEDPAFEKAHIALVTNMGDKAPVFTGAYEAHLVEGVLLLVDTNNPGASVSGTSPATVKYGNDNPLENPIFAGDVKLAIYMSASAIMAASVKKLQFKNETDDYENIRGEASVTVVGYNRADLYDYDKFLSANQRITNASSLVIATHSPNTLSWV